MSAKAGKKKTEKSSPEKSSPEKLSPTHHIDSLIEQLEKVPGVTTEKISNDAEGFKRVKDILYVNRKEPVNELIIPSKDGKQILAVIRGKEKYDDKKTLSFVQNLHAVAKNRNMYTSQLKSFFDTNKFLGYETYTGQTTPPDRVPVERNSYEKNTLERLGNFVADKTEEKAQAYFSYVKNETDDKAQEEINNFINKTEVTIEKPIETTETAEKTTEDVKKPVEEEEEEEERPKTGPSLELASPPPEVSDILSAAKDLTKQGKNEQAKILESQKAAEDVEEALKTGDPDEIAQANVQAAAQLTETGDTSPLTNVSGPELQEDLISEVRPLSSSDVPGAPDVSGAPAGAPDVPGAPNVPPVLAGDKARIRATRLSTGDIVTLTDGTNTLIVAEETIFRQIGKDVRDGLRGQEIVDDIKNSYGRIDKTLEGKILDLKDEFYDFFKGDKDPEIEVIAADPGGQPSAEGAPLVSEDIEKEYILKYHKIATLLLFGSLPPKWNIGLLNNIKNTPMPKEMIKKMIDGIIKINGDKIMVYKNYTSSKPELNEVLQLHFLIEKISQGGNAVVPISSLLGFANKLRTQPIQQTDQKTGDELEAFEEAGSTSQQVAKQVPAPIRAQQAQGPSQKVFIRSDEFVKQMYKAHHTQQIDADGHKFQVVDFGINLLDTDVTKDEFDYADPLDNFPKKFYSV